MRRRFNQNPSPCPESHNSDNDCAIILDAPDDSPHLTPRLIWKTVPPRNLQIVAFVLGDRSEQSCRRLWDKVPRAYRRCLSYRDFWKAYQEVLPKETHCAVGKESGQLSHMERWF